VRRSREEEDWFAWMLTGDIAGRGPAHEPIVVNVRPLARIWPGALRQAMQRNAQRFNVGNGSR
jgi:hypothetical protein